MIIDHIGKEEYFARVVFLYSFLFRECFHAGGFAISAAAKRQYMRQRLGKKVIAWDIETMFLWMGFALWKKREKCNEPVDKQ